MKSTPHLVCRCFDEYRRRDSNPSTHTLTESTHDEDYPEIPPNDFARLQLIEIIDRMDGQAIIDLLAVARGLIDPVVNRAR